MATDATHYILRTYGDDTQKADILPLIEILTASEASIHNSLGKTSATATVHETMTDTLSTAGSLAVTEGGDYLNSALTTPSRMVNLVQHVVKKINVSKVQQKIDHYHEENELERQTKKGMKDWMNSVEYDLVRSTLVSGASGTAPKMKGIVQAISKSTNTTAQTSGTVWSASILKGHMKDNWENSNGEVATDIYMGGYLKDLTDGFTNKTNLVSNGVNAKEIVNVVDIFETGFGKVRVHKHRYVTVSGTDATGRVLAIRPDKLRVAYLERPYVDKDLARSGAYDPRAIAGSMTLEVRNQDSNWCASGFNID